MGRARRLAARVGVAVSLIVFGLLVGVRVYSRVGTVVGMAPVGGDRGVIMSGQQFRTLEVTYVSGLPGARVGVWAGKGWRDVGPFMTWVGGRSFHGGGFGYRVGKVMVPLESRGGVAAYEKSHARAVTLGYPDTLAPPPETVVVKAWQVQAPMWFGMVLSAVGPAFWLIGFPGRWRREGRRRRGLCEFCGYDLRASEGRCPECGEMSK